MKARAPGKLLLTGAYAVLEGAPAVVVAVDRYAVATTSRIDPAPGREVAIAFGASGSMSPRSPAPCVDATALYEGGTKLGLGSSAAVLVAALGARALDEGACLSNDGVRHTLFEAARRAHAQAQGGGSGVDVAASVFGGALVYRVPPDGARIRSASVPEGLCIAAFFSGKSARTSDLRGRVDALRIASPSRFSEEFAPLVRASDEAAAAFERADVDGFLRAADAFRLALGHLGAAADAPIVPEAFATLAGLAAAAGGVFYPSGAGGGDVGVYLGHEPPPDAFAERARKLGMTPLALGVGCGGVHAVPEEGSAL